MSREQKAAIQIRALDALHELEQCVAIQIAVWGYSDGDVVPRRMFVLAGRIGGQVIGALEGDRVIGFAMALPGFRDGRSYLHSHMLAVLPPYRNTGLGRRLKLAQRDDAIARGFDLMEWTFDPLEIKNSYLNLARLGAISRRYQPDFYGPSSSPLQGGLPTDRLYAEWWVRSPRVCELVDGASRPALSHDGAGECIVVPGEVSAWKREPGNRGRAAEVQQRNRLLLQSAFARGLAAIGYSCTEDGGAFLIGPPPAGAQFR